MRTLEQILEGVTAGGQWRSGVTPVTDRSLYSSVFIVAPVFCLKTDAAYAAWAARHAPALVRALEEAIKAIENCDRHVGLLAGERNRLEKSRAVLAEALKD